MDLILGDVKHLGTKEEKTPRLVRCEGENMFSDYCRSFYLMDAMNKRNAFKL